MASQTINIDDVVSELAERGLDELNRAATVLNQSFRCNAVDAFGVELGCAFETAVLQDRDEFARTLWAARNKAFESSCK